MERGGERQASWLGQGSQQREGRLPERRYQAGVGWQGRLGRAAREKERGRRAVHWMSPSCINMGSRLHGARQGGRDQGQPLDAFLQQASPRQACRAAACPSR